MMGINVWTITHTFTALCAELGFPLYEERLYGVGEYASVRRPLVYDINDAILFRRTENFRCTRDGRAGAALVDVLEDLGGPGSIGRASMMLS